MTRNLLTIFALLIHVTLFGQAVNDDCNTAINLGTLPSPGVCSGGLQDGLPLNATTGETTIGSTPENPYISISNCSGGSMTQGANDVWFTFVASGTLLNINITPGSAPFLASPNVALWSGNCGNLLPKKCAIGTSSGSLATTATQITVGETYYLQISGNSPTATGNFQLSLNNDTDCNDCLRASEITASPQPVNGQYQPGTVVNFCYHITQWANMNTNWLHGVQINWGSGWANPQGAPNSTAPSASCSTDGFWQWYTSCTTINSNPTTYGPGFYYDYTLNPGNPANNFGDNCTTSNWNFCFSLTVASGASPGADLSVTINTTGDGESGNWTSLGCAADPTNIFLAQVAASTTMSASIYQSSGSNPSCANSLLSFTANAVNAGSSPSYQWKVNGVNTGTNNPVFTTSALANNDNVSCIVTSSSAYTTNSPFVTNSIVTLRNPLPPTPVITTNGPTTFCDGDSVLLSSSTSVSYLWSTGQTTQSIFVFSSQADSVKVTDFNGCSSVSAPLIITAYPSPSVTITSSGPTSFCQGGSVNLTANSNDLVLWNTGSADPTITVNTSQNYNVTATDANGCTASASIGVTVNPVPTLMITNPQPQCASGTVDISASFVTTGSSAGTLSY
jgi:hypothetical protein